MKFMSHADSEQQLLSQLCKSSLFVIVVVMKVGRLAVPMKASVSGERLSVVPPGG